MDMSNQETIIIQLSGENGIIRRAQPAQDDQLKTNSMKRTAQRRIRLSKIERS
jgi:hypothetical protein